MRFLLSDEARHDLESAVDYIADESPARALRLVDDLQGIFHFLATWPETGHRRPDLSHTQHHRFWIARGYLIGYDPTRDPLTIFCVLHGARDAVSVLSERFEGESL